MTAKTAKTAKTALAAAVAHDDSGAADYLSPHETRAMLADSREWRSRRVNAGDMLTSEAAAALMSTSRTTINGWVAAGRCIGLDRGLRGFRFPKWQVEPAILAWIPKIAEATGTREGWALLAFLEAPNPALGGRSPRQALEQGDVDAVLDAAAVEGTSDR